MTFSPPLSPPLSPLSPPRSSADGEVLVTRLRVSRELPDVHAKHEILKWVLRGIRTVRPCVFHLDQPQTMCWNMVEPTGSEKASSIVFQLHLEGSKTSQMSQRNSSKPMIDLRVLACLSCHTSKLNCYWHCFGCTYSNRNCFSFYCFSGNSKWLAERRGRSTHRNTVFAPWSTRPTETWTSRGEISHSSGALK